MIGYEEVRYPKKVVLPVAAVVVALIALMLWGAGAGTREVQAHPGDRIAGQVGSQSPLADNPDDVTDGPALAARLPYGSVRLSWQTGRRLSVGDTEHYTEGRTRLMTVRWSPRLWETDGLPGVWSRQRSTDDREPTSRLVLRAGGRRYVVTDELRAGNAPGSVTIAVAESTGLRLQVESGGRRQTATSSPSRSKAYGDTGDCGSEYVSGAGGCFKATRATYVRGLGTAPTGKDWLVVTDARIIPVADRESDDFVVETRELKGSDDIVEYVATGTPTLTLSVSGGPEPIHTRGETSLKRTAPRLNDRAYLVPSEQDVKVSLNYRTAARSAPGQDVPAGEPRRLNVAGGTHTLFVAPPTDD